MALERSHIMYVAPLMMAGVLALSAGLLFIAGWIGRPASGERTRISVQSDCAAEWEPVLRARVEMMGLGDPSFVIEGSVVVVEAVMPGRLTDERTVPAALVRPGKLTVRAAAAYDAVPSEELLATEVDVVETWLQLDLRGHPYVQAALQPNAAERLREASQTQALIYEIDEVEAGHLDADRLLEKNEIELKPSQAMLTAEMQLASDWHIALNVPAPCAATAVVEQ